MRCIFSVCTSNATGWGRAVPSCRVPVMPLLAGTQQHSPARRLMCLSSNAGNVCGSRSDCKSDCKSRNSNSHLYHLGHTRAFCTCSSCSSATASYCSLLSVIVVVVRCCCWWCWNHYILFHYKCCTVPASDSPIDSFVGKNGRIVGVVVFCFIRSFFSLLLSLSVSECAQRAPTP